MVLSGIGILAKQLPEETYEALSAGGGAPAWIGRAALYLRGHYTGQAMSFIAICASSLMYVVVSLVQWRTTFDLDRLLHRGPYAMQGESSLSIRDARGFWERLGFSREFTGTDRWVTYITLSWPLFWSIAFFSVGGYALFFEIRAESWLAYWRVWTWVVLGVGTIITVWLSVGGFVDLRKMYRMLRQRESARDNAE
jgi:SSS family solute:Na+ symporter